MKRELVRVFLFIRYFIGNICYSSISLVNNESEITSKSSKIHDLGNVRIVSFFLLEELIIQLETNEYSMVIDESTDAADTKNPWVCPVSIMYQKWAFITNSSNRNHMTAILWGCNKDDDPYL